MSSFTRNLPSFIRVKNKYQYKSKKAPNFPYPNSKPMIYFVSCSC